MKLKKLARDVFSNELTDEEKDRLADLWLSGYRLPLMDGLGMRDAALAKKKIAVPEHLAHLKQNLAWYRWTDTGLPVLLFPTKLVEL